MKFRSLLILISIASFSSAAAQNTSKAKFQLPEYCRKDSAKSKTIIGRKVKIWHEGGIYPTLNLDNQFVWPSAEMKLKGGENGWGNFKPKTGDTGVIVHIFIYKGDRQKYIYLLKIKENYVPIGCFYVTDLDKPDSEHLTAWNYLKNMDYAQGCKFKLANVNGKYAGAGETKIDSLSETCACDLIAKGIDTIILCKGYSGVSSTGGAVVFWQHDGTGYAKAFFMKKHDHIAKPAAESFAVTPLLGYFFNNRLDTISREFKPKLQADMPDLGGLSIQLYTPHLFFRQFIPQLLVRGFQKEPEAIWWQMVYNSISTLKKD